MKIVLKAEEEVGETGTLTITDEHLDNPNFVDLIFELKAKNEAGVSGRVAITVQVDELAQAAEVFDNFRRQRL